MGPLATTSSSEPPESIGVRDDRCSKPKFASSGIVAQHQMGLWLRPWAIATDLFLVDVFRVPIADKSALVDRLEVRAVHLVDVLDSVYPLRYHLMSF